MKEWVKTASDEKAVELGCYFDEKAALRIATFFRNFIRHTDGALAGKPFELLPWQWERVIAPAFGWKMPDGTRRFREVEIWIPKKNGKSTLAAAITLYLLLADGEIKSRVYGAAADREQASIVFDAAVSMIEMNDDLISELDVKKSKREIRYDGSNSLYKVINAMGFRNEGYNIHGLIFDELHTQRNRKLWSALKYGGASRRQPIRFVISTVGEHDESLLWMERFNHAKAVQESKVIDIRTLACVYAAEPKDDWTSPETWKKSNPSYGYTISPVDFEIAYEDACKNALNEVEFKRYRLNLATKHATSWIRWDHWEKNILQRLEYPQTMYHVGEETLQIATKPVSYAGVDIMDTMDINAFVDIREVKKPDGVMAFQIESIFWAPENAGIEAQKMNRERYEEWFATGVLRTCKGYTTDQEQLEDDIVDFCKQRNVAEIGVDRFMATRLVYGLQAKFKKRKIKTKLRLVGYNGSTLNEACRFLEGLIVSGRIIHDNNPVMNWMFGNVKAIQDSSGNRKLDKSGGAAGKIDGFAALLIATYCAINIEPEFKSKYDTEKPASILL